LSQKEQEILDLRKRNTIAAAKSRQRKAEKMKDLQNVSLTDIVYYD
jgi:hypothetical protein